MQDIKSTLHKKKTGLSTPKWLMLLAVVTLLLIFWGWRTVEARPEIQKSTLRLATIERGNFSVLVEGYGKLKAKHQRFLTSQTQAVVDSINLYPGAEVNRDSVILQLSDPALRQAVDEARLELARQRALAKEQSIAQQSELLEREAQMALLNSDLESARLRQKAEAKLVDKGVVSQLDFKRTQLHVSQLVRRLDIEIVRYGHLQDMHAQQAQVREELLKQFQLNFNTIRGRYDMLTVRAGLDGVLQTLSVEIGQSVPAGTPLAVVGSNTQLIVELKVQQGMAEQVSPGMSATVNTYGNRVEARVTRIDPVVTDGRVMVELDLIGELPGNARPDLTVEGQIEVRTINDTLIVEQPADVYAFDKKALFVVAPDGQSASQLELEFGTLSSNKLEVISGAHSGQALIVSDTTAWREQERVLLRE